MVRRIAALGLVVLLTAGARAEEMLRIPGPGGVTLVARLCPAERETGNVAIIAHGSPPRAAARPGMAPVACGSEAVRWFAARGWTVIAPMRRGYGETGGRWAEGFGHCWDANFRAAGEASADDLAAVVAAAKARGAQRIVVAGQSAGGWAAIALAARNPADVAGFLNFAGGRGGYKDGIPNANCSPDRLIEAARAFGATARTPMLWIYAANDSFFAPELAAALHRAFTDAGGTAAMHALGPYGTDGHRLFFGAGGPAVWGPLTETFLARLP